MTEQLPDIPRFLTGIAEWAACLVYILPRRRLALWPFVALAGLWLGVQVGVQLVAGELPLAAWVPGMLTAIAAMFGFVRLTAATTTAAVYLTAPAFVLAELVAAAHWQLHCFFFRADPTALGVAPILFGLVLYTAAFCGVGLIERRHNRAGPLFLPTPRDLAAPIALAVATFCISNVSFFTQSTPLSGRQGPEVFYIRTLVDLCGFVALYAWQGQRLQQRAKAEVAAIQGLLRSQHEQYLQSKRSIDAVNRTYHDLKHQIGVIRAESDPARRNAHIAELEASLAGYGSVVKTGNEVVDVILATKAMACAERGIDLTTVADGAAVAFVSTADLCTILGNALDNAIEAAGQMPDPAQRLIKLTLFGQSQFAVLAVENSFRGQLRLEEGEIVTSHADRDHHGFGLKSIKYVADKYGGSMTAQAEGEWFVLRVLLPVPAGAGTEAVVTPATESVVSQT